MSQTSSSSATHRGRYLRRVLHIGRALVTGPIALFPPREIDTFGWLEPVLRIEADPLGVESVRSISILADHTMNRDEDLLQPVIRRAEWNRALDKKNRPNWPTVDISLGYCEDALAQVEEVVLGLQSSAQRLPFVAFGLSTHRTRPESPGDLLGFLELYLVNGAQSLTFRAQWRTDNDLAARLSPAFAQIEAAMQPIPRAGWRERYDADLRNERVGMLWDWDGAISVPPATIMDT